MNGFIYGWMDRWMAGSMDDGMDGRNAEMDGVVEGSV